MKKKHFNSYLMRIYCACAILLPIVIIFSTTIASRINEERYKRLVYGNSMEALRLFSDTINKMMLETADDMVQYIFDKDVGFYLNNAFAPNDYTVRMHVQEKLRDLRQYNELVESVYLFSGLRSEVLTLEGVWSADTFYDPLVVSASPGLTQRAQWTGSRSVYDPLRRKQLHYVSVLRKMEDSETSGVLCFNISTEKIVEILSPSRLYGQGLTLLFAADNSLIAHSAGSDTLPLADSMTQRLSALLQQGMPTELVEIELDGVPYYATFTGLSSNGWTLARTVSADLLLSDVRKTQAMMAVVFLMAALVQIAIMIYMGKRITMPFINFARSTSQKVGDAPSDYYNEIRYLDQTFSKLVEINDTLRQQYADNLAQLTGRFIRRLLEQSQHLPPEQIEDGIIKYQLQPLRSPATVVAFNVDHDDWQQRELIKLQLAQLLRDALPAIQLIHCTMDESKAAVILSEEAAAIEREALIGLLGQLVLPYNEHELIVTAGVSLRCPGAQLLSAAWQEALLALECRHMYDNGGVYDYSLISGAGELSYPAAEVKQLVAALNASDSRLCEAAVNTLLGYYEAKTDMSYVQFLGQLSQIFVITLKIFIDRDSRLEVLLEQDLNLYHEFSTHRYTTQQIREWLTSFYRNMLFLSGSGPDGDGQNQLLVEKALDYIHAHYAEDLSLDGVSRMVFVSLQYFNKLFKAVKGTTFGNYLIRYRLDKAALLLATTSLKIKDIALQTGFNSQDYFTKAFKKDKGISPLEYRKRSVIQKL